LVVVAPVKPPAATSVVPPTEVPPGKERIWFSEGWLTQQHLYVTPVVSGLRKELAPKRAS
jgi:hypothetical protein